MATPTPNPVQRPVRLGRKSAVKSVVIVRNEDGTMERTVLYKPKRRGSKRWRKMEKLMRRLNESQAVAAKEYGERHERSNKKKKNGWLKDLGKNLSKAQKKGFKKIKIRVL